MSSTTESLKHFNAYRHAAASKQRLSTDQAELVELMQKINFGRIVNLRVRRGQPVLKPRPTVIREHKFGGENGPRPEMAANDFLLRDAVVELFQCIHDLHDGMINVLEVKHGLPFRMTVTEEAA